jgi:hypothetical protein
MRSPAIRVAPGTSQPSSSQTSSGTISARCGAILPRVRRGWSVPMEAIGCHRSCRPGKRYSAKGGCAWRPKLID